MVVVVGGSLEQETSIIATTESPEAIMIEFFISKNYSGILENAIKLGHYPRPARLDKLA